MKKFRLLLSVLLFLSGGGRILLAQEQITVKGTVSEFGTDEPLAGVVVVAGSSGVSTLNDGSYTISVPPGTTLSYQNIGFETATFTVPS